MTAHEASVVIVGAGHAGASAAIALRSSGHRGPITVVTDETDPPYERPPLTKEYLRGEKSFERLLLRPTRFWEERRIVLRQGCRATAVDPRTRVVSLGSDGELPYGALIWAAGGAPRELGCEGSDLEGVHVIRTRRDVDALASELPSAQRIVIVGGGYIGLESAAVLRSLGKDVVIVESQDRVLPRAAGRTLAAALAAEHRARGAGIRTSTQVERLLGAEGRVSGVCVKSGEVLPADLVILSVGIVPASAPLLAAGARGGSGVLVDAGCRTSLEGIFAIGDCTLQSSVYTEGTTLRLESVQNATDQALAVARSITGAGPAEATLPWFWSHQYDLKVQIAGLQFPHHEEIVRGDPLSRRFSVAHLKAGQLMAMECVNQPADYLQSRKIIPNRIRMDAAKLRDVRVPLKECTA